MGHYAAFKFRCDGTCGRTIGDIGFFLWKHEGDKCYCPDCWPTREVPKPREAVA